MDLDLDPALRVQHRDLGDSWGKSPRVGHGAGQGKRGCHSDGTGDGVRSVAPVRCEVPRGHGAGGVAVLPALAPIIETDLVPEQREGLHAEAALVRLERG